MLHIITHVAESAGEKQRMYNELTLPLFCSEFVVPYEESNRARVLDRTLKEIGLPPMGVHALRPTFATRTVELGMDLRTLSEILGHTKVSLPLQFYARSTIKRKSKLLQVVLS